MSSWRFQIEGEADKYQQTRILEVKVLASNIKKSKCSALRWQEGRLIDCKISLSLEYTTRNNF